MATTIGLQDLPPTPLLSEKHSGIPERWAEQCKESKARLYSLKTLPASVPREGELPVLPPGIDRPTFNTAIAELKETLGEEHVELNDKPLVDGWYMEHPNTHDTFHVLEQSKLVSSAQVYPGSVEDIQTIVRWANKYLIPIYPISIGRNMGYGGAAPRVPGSVTIDLGRRMNKVLKIDGNSASCIVEPGVTYFALYEEVQKTGLPLWIDTPDVGGGSVLGNCIDRGVGYTPYGDHWANHCGLEVVLPSGEIMRTGMGALPGKNGADNPSWQAFQHAYGPSVDGIFSQSNFGIVTKMGMWLMPATGHQSYMITFPEEDDFEQIIEIIRPLALNRVLGNIPQLRSVIQELAITGRPKSDFYDGKDPIPMEVIKAHAKNMPCGECAWVFYGTVYGPEETRNSQLDIIRQEFSKVRGSKFFLPEDMPEDHYIHPRARICSGVPELRELDWLNWKPNCAHLAFSPITPTRGQDARIVHEIVTRLHKKWGFDSLPTWCVSGREMHYIAEILIDRSDPDEKRRAICCMREMITEAAAEGYGEYRTHLIFQDQISRTYGWGNQALMRFNETLKDALDPNGILAPGRAGIWPKSYRDKGWEILPEDEPRTSVKTNGVIH
ncbi:vanillyl-alcohol oxidase [Gloeophyllum trabeum ATCC 11539]|uniref:Vanillyl-alcohol oxidase n=1 Tax=Gloeophyllum trabeum (strain ATCC 11539 / FP-39264 / Madison 617) TaxID=670483 RepID=S7R8B6_GLOTA|nr:vanillyl-alcohol oxidase [Gloeophyllum trabeum ATCC 11539]EPQ50565.1 vanillyl-alcohol oxidase [Gloeophyllum trabeum ATCC 11539]